MYAITQESIIEEINTRYAMFDRPVDGSRNVIIDSFMPKHLKTILKKYPQEVVYPKTYAAISEFTSDLLSVPLVPREDLFRLVGYSPKDIKSLLQAVASKDLTFTMIGFGGTNSNTLHWLYEMSTLCNVSNVFKNIYIVEPDKLEYHNTLRMPMSTLRNINSLMTTYQYNTEIQSNLNKMLRCSLYGFPNSPEIATNIKNISELVNSLSTGSELYNYLKYVTLNADIDKNMRSDSSLLFDILKLDLVDKKYTKLARNRFALSTTSFYGGRIFANALITDNSRTHLFIDTKTSKDNIFYGAPDIHTRIIMKEKGIPLLTGTHGNDDVALTLNPTQDIQLQRESYGMIKLTTFFLNQIRLTIALLEYLASDYDLSEPNKTILDYSYARDAKPLATKRQWQLQLQHTGLMEG